MDCAYPKAKILHTCGVQNDRILVCVFYNGRSEAPAPTVCARDVLVCGTSGRPSPTREF